MVFIKAQIKRFTRFKLIAGIFIFITADDVMLYSTKKKPNALISIQWRIPMKCAFIEHPVWYTFRKYAPWENTSAHIVNMFHSRRTFSLPWVAMLNFTQRRMTKPNKVLQQVLRQTINRMIKRIWTLVLCAPKKCFIPFEINIQHLPNKVKIYPKKEAYALNNLNNFQVFKVKHGVK